MSVSIIYKNTHLNKKSLNLVLFVDEKFNISNQKKYFLKSEFSLILDLLKTRDIKKQILNFDISSKKKIILVSLSEKMTSSDLETLGAKFYDQFKVYKQNQYILNSDSLLEKSKNIVMGFLHG